MRNLTGNEPDARAAYAAATLADASGDDAYWLGRAKVIKGRQENKNKEKRRIPITILIVASIST
jgi:hypothetical protein